MPFEIIPLSRARVSFYKYSIVTRPCMFLYPVPFLGHSTSNILILMLILILKAFLVRPLQEGHGCITVLVNPSYKIQLLNVKHKIKIVSFKKFSKVGDVGFSANVFGESVPCRRTSVRKDTLAELGTRSR